MDRFHRSIILPPCPMTNNTSDSRSPIAIAVHWASQVTTISIEMVLPILLGVWVDSKLGTKAVFTIVGGIGGLWMGIWYLLRITKTIAEGDNKRKPENKNGQDNTEKPSLDK
jgi:ATP synthase protein I